MNTRVLILFVAVVVTVTGCSRPQGTTVIEKKTHISTMRNDLLAQLYEAKPEAKAKVADAAGYGTFSNVNVHLFLASTGNGYGVVHNNSTGEQTYMRMAMLGAGLGMGVKDFRAVIIFKNQNALNTFVEQGWEFGGHADAAAKSGDKGAEVSAAAEVTGNMEIYNFTESGIALQATVAGTKYWKDKELN
jgi:lipid-binding SYLF domain-containing protein